MVPLRAFRKTLFLLAVALASAAGASVLPGNSYQRWQLLDGTIHANARWIYERSSFDPTPIDVAFLGPSRTEVGVDAPRLSAELAARGLTSNVVNFSFPELGRNINLVAAQELFAHKKPKLLVLGVVEKPSRFGHSAFKYLADPSAIAFPGYFGDLDYFSDLIYLPFRQMQLFAANVFPGGMGLAKEFDASQYRGQSTHIIFMPGGRIAEPSSNPGTPAELDRTVKKYEASIHPPLLPPGLADYEFGDERHYIREIAELAQKNGAKVAFLFQPYLTGPGELRDLQELKFYEQYGPVLNAGFLASHPEWFADYGHLDRQGSNILTDWLAEPVGRLLTDAKASL